MKRLAIFLAAAFLVAACNGQNGGSAPAAPAAAKPAAAGDSPFIAKNEIKEFMGHAIDHNADGIWLNQGWVIDGIGCNNNLCEHELFPTDAKGWLDTSSAALSLAELANALMIPERIRDEDPAAWKSYATALYTTSMCAHEAAEKAAKSQSEVDKQAYFEAGGKIYEVCKDCHQRFILMDDKAPAPTGCSTTPGTR